jgi:hypothetical protein
MKKTSLILVIKFFIIVSAFSQTITKPPIFKAAYKSLTVENGGCNTCIKFLYQHPDFNTIIDIVGFTLPNIDVAIGLTDRMLEILSMPTTGKEEHIYDDYSNVSIVRYGFQQKSVHVGSKEKRQFSKGEITKLRLALIQEKSKM